MSLSLLCPPFDSEERKKNSSNPLPLNFFMISRQLQSLDVVIQKNKFLCNMNSEEHSEFWEPPSESELKIIQARRERTDKISKLMGEYLLKGYKMLCTACEVCNTILLQDRQERFYCVGCSEVDNEHSKDNPVLGGTAALRQIEEAQFCGGEPASSSNRQSSPVVQASTLFCSVSTSPTEQHENIPNISSTDEISPSCHKERKSAGAVAKPYKSNDAVAQAIETVQEKLTWAARKLAKNNSIEGSVQCCQLLKTCADTLISLQQLQEFSHS